MWFQGTALPQLKMIYSNFGAILTQFVFLDGPRSYLGKYGQVLSLYPLTYTLRYKNTKGVAILTHSLRNSAKLRGKHIVKHVFLGKWSIFGAE